MGGVHVSKSSSQHRDLQIEAENKLFIKGLIREIRGQYIEILAIGQAVARSADLQLLATEIRKNGRAKQGGLQGPLFRSGCRVAATHMSWAHVHAGSTPATRTILAYRELSER